MTRQQSATHVADSNGAIVFICRDPGRRGLVERLVQPLRTHGAAVDALLAVARTAPKAVLLNLEDVAGSEHDVLAALQRCRPHVPVYVLVAPQDEPLARKLVAEGATDYFVLPSDIRRLPSLLQPEVKTASRASAAPVADQRAAGWFRAACDLAELAVSQPQPLFRDGAMLILRALGARQGCVFSRGAEAGGLERVVTFGDIGPEGSAGVEVERAAAERVLRTGEALLVEAGTAGAAPPGLLCVPVRDADTTFGVLCVTGKTDGTPLDRSDCHAAAALLEVLAHLYRSALLRNEYARLALREVGTGLLKADPFLTCLEAQISRAEGLRAEVGLLLLEPQPGVPAQEGQVLQRLGVAIRAALARGWEAGCLGTALYAVAVPRASQNKSRDETENDFYGMAAARLAAVGPRVDARLRLRTALAVFPRDGTTARALVAAAEARLAVPA